MFSSMRARIDKCFSVIYFAESKQTITRSACSRKSARRTMLLESLRQQVLEANLELVRRGLVLYTFGNASGISRPDGLVVIKPSVLPYEAFLSIGGVAHTHSECATAWAQARRPIPCFGTTHADYFHGSVPVTDVMAD